MNNFEFQVRELIKKEFPLPNESSYAFRLQQLFEVGRLDLSIAKLAEAHWDAVAILAEDGRKPYKNSLYAVWASEIPGKKVQLNKKNNHWSLTGTKMFCSGAGLVDRALVTVDDFLFDLDLTNQSAKHFKISSESWVAMAFKETKTSTIHFNEFTCSKENILGKKGWYLQRKGFWPGALDLLPVGVEERQV